MELPLEWLELGVKARLSSSTRRVRSRAGNSWSGPGPNGHTGRQAGRGRPHGQQGTEQVSGTGWSRCGIKVFGVFLAGAQGRELHLPLCLP